MTESTAEKADDTAAEEQEALLEEDEQIEELGAPTLSAALEALLLVADEPIPAVMLAQTVRRPVPEVEECIADLVREYDEAERGFELREVAGGWRYYTRSSCSDVVSRWVLDGQQARLTQAALETLAVVAYRQPVTRARISAVRGVNVEGVLRTLMSRGLVAEAGTESESGAHLYRTTPYFLERMGISSLEELPDLAELLPGLAELEELSASTEQ